MSCQKDAGNYLADNSTYLILINIASPWQCEFQHFYECLQLLCETDEEILVGEIVLGLLQGPTVPGFPALQGRII